jgi:hypothetical protein
VGQLEGSLGLPQHLVGEGREATAPPSRVPIPRGEGSAKGRTKRPWGEGVDKASRGRLNRRVGLVSPSTPRP